MLGSPLGGRSVDSRARLKSRAELADEPWKGQFLVERYCPHTGVPGTWEGDEHVVWVSSCDRDVIGDCTAKKYSVIETPMEHSGYVVCEHMGHLIE